MDKQAWFPVKDEPFSRALHDHRLWVLSTQIPVYPPKPLKRADFHFKWSCVLTRGGQAEEKGRNAWGANLFYRDKLMLVGHEEVMTVEYTCGLHYVEGNRSEVEMVRSSGSLTVVHADTILHLLAAKPGMMKLRASPPTAEMVWSSVLMDCDVIDHPSFESWAGDLGFDADSRKAEAIYRLCLERAVKLRVTLGNELFEKLRELSREV